jgi:hypothetical protein
MNYKKLCELRDDYFLEQAERNGRIWRKSSAFDVKFTHESISLSGNSMSLWETEFILNATENGIGMKEISEKLSEFGAICSQ